MNEGRRRQAEAIFQQALDLSADERDAFNAARCGPDADLRAEVEELLHAAEEQTPPVLRTDWVRRDPPHQPRGPERQHPDDSIGPYTVLSTLGEGGMGTVYLAEQSEPLRRRVAIKVIKLGMDTDQVIRRFEAERQALALMDHPNVARVYDAGATETGRPYFVMEHVSGDPITAYCDRQRLSTRDRLTLFMQVCAAVQHAHHKGVIHRDLKASNVLLSGEGEEATVKVIDFGVAKATAQPLTERTLFTEEGQLVGTPECMSPEQADGGVDVDTRTDVYALGVMLYELLTGTLPLDPKRLRREGLSEIRRIIREEVPPRPSTRLARTTNRRTDEAPDGSVAESVGKRHGSDPRTLVRRLRRDLDWIVMKSLEKDRARRYDTANALAMDIRRHLEHEPVLAGPPTAGYRLWKVVRRHRAPLAVATSIIVALAAGLALAGYGLMEAGTERDRAVDSEARAQSVIEFLNDDLLAAVAPSGRRGRGRDVLMREVLEVAAERIDEASGAGGRFADRPLVESSIRQTLGRTLYLLGEFSSAEPHLLRARELRRRELGDLDPATLVSMGDLASLYASYTDDGRLETAETLQRQVLEENRRRLGPDHRDTLMSANNLANTLVAQSDFEEAGALFVATLETQTRVLGAEDHDTLLSMNNLGRMYASIGRLDEAQQLLEPAVEIRTRAPAADERDAIPCLVNLAIVYRRQGLVGKAESLNRRVVEMMKRIYGADHPDTVATINNLAISHAMRGQLDEAERLFRGTLEIQTRVLGEEHRQTLNSMNNLGWVYAAQNRAEEAETLYLRTLRIEERALEANHPTTLNTVGNLADLYASQGRLAEAEAFHRRALAGQREKFGAGSQEALETMTKLARLYFEQGHTSRARSLTEETIRIRRDQASRPDASPQIRIGYAQLLLTCEPPDLRDPDEALGFAIAANEMTNVHEPNYLGTLSEAYHRTGDLENAIATRERAIALLPVDSQTRDEFEQRLAALRAAAAEAMVEAD